jgi:hypothetical protein
MLVWSSFFDDYPQLSWVLAGETDTMAAEKLFVMLDWAYSKKERKRGSRSARDSMFWECLSTSPMPPRA